MRIAMISALALACAGAAHAGAIATNTEASPPADAASGVTTINIDVGTLDARDPDAGSKAALRAAAALIQKGQPQLALVFLDKLIAEFETRYGTSSKQVFCAHAQAEAVLYMGMAAAAKKDAIALDGTYCDAYFLRGFAKVDLLRPDEAEADYARALALAPNNPHYLSEMGELHASRRDWDGALAFFHRAEDAAPTCSPPGQDKAELARALRGIGYSDIELGRLDEAEALYRRCLEIDAGDEKARNELVYVLNLKAQQAGVTN